MPRYLRLFDSSFPSPSSFPAKTEPKQRNQDALTPTSAAHTAQSPRFLPPAKTRGRRPTDRRTNTPRVSFGRRAFGRRAFGRSEGARQHDPRARKPAKGRRAEEEEEPGVKRKAKRVKRDILKHFKGQAREEGQGEGKGAGGSVKGGGKGAGGHGKGTGEAAGARGGSSCALANPLSLIAVSDSARCHMARGGGGRGDGGGKSRLVLLASLHPPPPRHHRHHHTPCT